MWKLNVEKRGELLCALEGEVEPGAVILAANAWAKEYADGHTERGGVATVATPTTLAADEPAVTIERMIFSQTFHCWKVDLTRTQITLRESETDQLKALFA